MSTLTFLITGGCLLSVTCLNPNRGYFKEMALDVLVQDEQGQPVERSKIQTWHKHWLTRSPVIFLLIPINKNFAKMEVKTTRYTNNKGGGKLRYHTNDSRACLSITKDGWYPSNITLPSSMPETQKKWTKKPKKITAHLRKIQNPIPLYFGDTGKSLFPENFETPVGYDLILQDWMPPHGKGQNEDVVLTLREIEWKKVSSSMSFGEKQKVGVPVSSVEYVFPGLGNGVCSIPQFYPESILPTPHQAPENGYELNQRLNTENLLYTGYGCRTQRSNLEGDYFFFRIRTQYDDKNNIISAYYGLILGEIQLFSRNNQIKLVSPYWINPTPNDRNLEPVRDKRGQIIPYEGQFLK